MTDNRKPVVPGYRRGSPGLGAMLLPNASLAGGYSTRCWRGADDEAGLAQLVEEIEAAGGSGQRHAELNSCRGRYDRGTGRPGRGASARSTPRLYNLWGADRKPRSSSDPPPHFPSSAGRNWATSGSSGSPMRCFRRWSSGRRPARIGHAAGLRPRPPPMRGNAGQHSHAARNGRAAELCQYIFLNAEFAHPGAFMSPTW